MSILIRSMEMPENCKNCMDAKLNVAVSLFGAMCPFCEKIFLADIDIKKQRLDDCPLVEIPTPHGRLIDADELANKTFYSVTSAPYITYKKFVDAPTVIEAEGSEE